MAERVAPRRIGFVLLGVFFALFLFATRIATFLTDLWWYDALGYRSVMLGRLSTQIVLAVVFGLVMAAVVAANLTLARRIRPRYLITTPQEAVVERFRQLADPYLPWVIAGIAVLFGLTAGTTAAAHWQEFLLWRNAQPFGIPDPQFDKDVGFFVFQLPWLSFAQSWLFTGLTFVGLLTAGAHYLLGAIRPYAPGEKVTAPVKAHLSVLLALIIGARAWGYWLDRYKLNFSPRGQVTGASYTDIKAELPALNLLLLVSAVAIVLVLINIRNKGWLLPGAAVGLLVLASIVLQGVYPEIIQRFQVEPQELQREAPFIERNLDGTLAGYGLDDVARTRFPVADDLSAGDLEAYETTLSNVRLWDPDTLRTTYAQLQALRPYYAFGDVDLDRYPVDGENRLVLLSARDLQLSGLSETARNWQNTHLFYTHGYGIVSSQVNAATSQGQPVFLTRDIPTRGLETLSPARAGVYFGDVSAEDSGVDYSIVRTEQEELDYEVGEGVARQTTTYDGEGGVALGNIFRRLMFALRFGDPNLVLSGLLRSDSEVLMHRHVAERVHLVAPFLVLDRDPYPVVLDDRILWVQDAYTVSDHYPYSERLESGEDGPFPELNYVRNSVKAVVDAYDGTVTLYVIDEDDPVLAAWRSAFPAPFAPMAEMPDGLEEHFRYPQDLFLLQSEVFRTYHVSDVGDFFSGAQAWDIPRDASFVANNPGSESAPPLDPYYLLTRLPGETEEEFVLIQPYLARDKPNMTAWFAGRSDPGTYGDLVAVNFPSDETILGPQQAQARIEQESEVSQYITLRDQAGSQVIRGNLIVLPIERSVLYIEPLFITSGQAQIPQLDQIVVVLGDRVEMRPTLAEALAAVLGAPPPDDPGEPGEPGEPPDEEATLDELITQALEAFRLAELALREGDLAEYQAQVERAELLLEQAAELQGIEPEPSPSPAPTVGTTTPTPTGSESALPAETPSPS